MYNDKIGHRRNVSLTARYKLAHANYILRFLRYLFMSAVEKSRVWR